MFPPYKNCRKCNCIMNNTHKWYVVSSGVASIDVLYLTVGIKDKLFYIIRPSIYVTWCGIKCFMSIVSNMMFSKYL